MRLSFFFLLAICTLVAGAPSRRVGHVVHEKRTVEPVAWTRTRRLEAHKILPLRIGLTQQNIHELEELLMSVAHPDSPTFGQHWSPEQVMDHFAPSEVTVSTVKSWLIASGFHPARIRVSHNKGWIDVNATTSQVESLLDAEYYVYTHTSGQEQISPCCTAPSPRTSCLTCATGCESYSVPDYIRKHVDLIKPTVHFIHRFPDDPAVHRKRSNIKLGAPSPSNGPKTNGATVTVPLSLDNCDKFITPACLRALYSIYYTPIVPHRNSYAIGAFSSAKPNSPPSDPIQSSSLPKLILAAI